MGLLARAQDLQSGDFTSNELTGGGTLSTLVLGGDEMSLIVADRGSGYHSKAHQHAAEQLNYVVSGEIWIFVEDEGFLAQEGDFFRIPANAVHWSRVKGDQPCRLVEAHAPSIAGDELWRDKAFSCYRDDEPTSSRPGVTNVFLSGYSDKVAEVEARYFHSEMSSELDA